MLEVDARGLSCPLPVMHARKALESDPESLAVLVDSGTAKANVANMLADAGYAVTAEESDGGWRLEAERA